MKSEIFDYPPTVELLKWLTPGSLRQNLAKALRLWVILRSIYGDEADEVKLQLGEDFTYLQWRNQFFSEAKKHHQRNEIPTLHDRECRCAKTLKEWLFTSTLSIEREKWCQSFKQNYPIQPNELETLLSTGIISSQSEITKQSKKLIHAKNIIRRKPLSDGCLFAVTGKNIVEFHFARLVDMGWLLKKSTHQNESEQNLFSKVTDFPPFPVFNQVDTEIESEQFTNYELAAFNNNFSQPINGIQRFFIHVEYIVHQKLSQQVESLKKQLKSLWNKDVVSLVKLTYSSAKLYQDTVDCIVYPVCIYYYQRALYLFAYGQTPKQDSKNKWDKIDWYDYRLDRIIKLEELQSEDFDIPQDFMQKCYGQSPPSPDDIKEKMAAAWGFDFYKPQELLLLRFDQYFYANYIEGTERDEMFKKVSYTQANKIITSNAQLEWEQKQHLLLTLESRSSKDVYCKVDYRVNDNNIVMRLRAWGPNVEVILPWKLRQRMAEDMQATWKLYK